MLDQIVVLVFELADDLLQIGKLFCEPILKRVDALLLTRYFLVDAVDVSLYALLSERQRAVDGANKIVHRIRDALADTVLNQRKEITDARRVLGEGVAELSVVNRKRAVFLEFYPDIGKKHKSDADSTGFG